MVSENTRACRLFFLTILGKKEVKKVEKQGKKCQKRVKNPAEI
jgi:hypothetical protein